MISKHHPLLSIVFCIALVITLLPLIGAVEPASAASGYIHGTVKSSSGTPLANIPVVVWRKDGGLCVVPKTNSGGYFNTGTIQDPDNKGFQVNANKNDQGDRITRYQQEEKGPYYLGNPSGTVVDFYLPTATDTSKVTISGQVVAEVGSAPLPGINVFFWRQDNGDTFYLATDANGKFSVQKDKSTDPKKRYNVMANKNNNDGKYNGAWYNSTEQVNILPDRDRSLYFRLPTGTVKFDGMVKNDKGVALSGIEVFLWRHDGKSWKVTTGSDGKWSAMVDRSSSASNPDHRINIMANKYGSGFNPNTAYLNSTEMVNKLADRDQSLSYFYLTSSTVKFDGMVKNDKGVALSGIEVYLWRHDGKSWKVTTGSDGKWSAMVDRSSSASNPDHRINIMANKYGSGFNPNTAYLNSTEIINKLSDRDQSLSYFYLYSSTVLFSGNVTNDRTQSGIPNIGVQLKRNSDGTTICARTDSKGMWKASVPRSSDTNHKYTITANPNNACLPWNAAYSTASPVTSGTPSYDQLYNFYLKGGTTPAPAPTITGVSPSEGGRSLTISSFVVSGTNFVTGATVKLTRSGSLDMVPSISSVTGTSITSSFGIPSGAATGAWNVVVTNPDNQVATATGAFTVKDIVSPLPNPNELEIKDLNGEMVSPTDFGVGMSIRYPAALPSATKRYIRVVISINGKPLDRTFDVTQYTSPGNVWSTQSGGQVSASTPLRFNLETEGVSRFSTDLPVPVSVTASYEGETETKSASRQAEVRLPVIVFHGACPPGEYPHCTVKNDLLIDWALNYAGYEPISSHLSSRGYHDGNGYRNLYAPGLLDAMYKHPQQAVPSDILNDVEGFVTSAKASSYSTRVNLVGHSFGGLVSQYYASQRPGNVQKVITVGTPFKGITQIYKEMFSPKWNRAMVDANITTPGGQPNLLLWGGPKDYTAYTLPPNPPAGINVQVTNSYTYAPQPGVEYHYIYATNIDTDKTVNLALNADGTWYRTTSVSQAKGDGTVLIDSGSNTPGPTGPNIFRHPIQAGSVEGSGGLITTNHGSLMMDNLIHDEIMTSINRGTPLGNTY
jgi:pimeloyl-ACP methyl ester carboxylesterase